MDYTKFEIVSIKTNPDIGESWVKTRIAEDPSILGLGDVVLKDAERPQTRAGILDLLLQDTEYNSRYEVEVQLGQTDESHIIRTIEYWDVERRRFPQYEHTAVIVAEDITSRFLNVISLFNGMIPLIAIQMKALQNGNKIGLMFTTVVNQMSLGLVGEDEEVSEAADRTYWEKRGTKKTVAIADELLELVQKHDKSLELKYNKFYIGLSKEGQPMNFVRFRPQKVLLRLEPKLKETPETSDFLESAGLDIMDYDKRWGRYRIRLKCGEVEKHRKVLEDVVERAFVENSKT